MDNKISVSRKEHLWLYGVTIGVFALSNFSVAYPVVGIIQSVFLLALMGYSLFRLIQNFKDARRHYKSSADRFEHILENPKVVEAFEAAMNQAAVSAVNKSHDKPQFVRALQKVRIHAKS